MTTAMQHIMHPAVTMEIYKPPVKAFFI